MTQLCEHFKPEFLHTPTATTRISKEECSQCFQNWDSEEGLDICLTCFNTCCPSKHSKLHYQLHQHPVSLHLKRKKIQEDEPPLIQIDKLAVIPTDDSKKYEVYSTVKCHLCRLESVPIEDENIQGVVNAILNATSAKMQEEMKTWELEVTACKHTETLEQSCSEHRLPEKPVCQLCDLQENLWLCLVCGHVGCGRAQVGGQPGFGHGLAHSSESGHHVVAKLGTITPEGNADVFCYTCGEERLDPYLGQHLLALGIQIEHQKRTEASLIEMQIKQNMEFSMVSRDGQSLPPVSGPWLTGLSNLGNSCYMNVILQLLATLPSFRTMAQSKHQEACYFPPLECWACQWVKLAMGMAQGHVISPLYFKALVCRGHPDFGSMKQQDVSEFLPYLFQQLESKKNTDVPDLISPFRHQTIQKLECHECRGISFTEATSESLSLMLPAAVLLQVLNEPASATPLDALHCIEQMSTETVDFQCPHCHSPQKATKRMGFQSFPDFLVVVTQRFVYDGWVPRKSEIQVAWPETLDLSPFYLEKDASGIAIEKPEVAQLMSFGIEKEKAVKALQQCHWNVEVAMNALMDHPEQFEDQDGGDVSTLVSMGFARPLAERALRETQSVEASIEWLFQNADAAGTETATETLFSSEASPSSARYRMFGFINHKGSSMHCGHYICHFLDDQKRWVLFDDEKVVLASDIKEMSPLAYVYILKRI